MSDMSDALQRANDQRADLRRWDHINTEPARLAQQEERNQK